MNVLSLFDGMSCGRVALHQTGIHVDNYYASEIDKHAVKVSSHNWPKNKNMGDITKWNEWDIDWSKIDLIMGGSPCQGFSSLGKNEGLEDPRSALFFHYVDILNFVKSKNPNVKFILENVKMKNSDRGVISSYLGVDGILINAAEISPCSRPRYYWCNFKIDEIEPVRSEYVDFVDTQSTDNTMSDGFHEWWERNKDKQLSKGYSKVINGGGKGVCLTTRQYASWNGNYIETPEWRLRKPTKSELALLVGAPSNYFDQCSQRQAEVMTGNGWDIRVIEHILKSMIKNG